MLPGLPEAQQAAAADVATCIAAHAASGPQPEMWRSQELDRVALRLSQGHFLVRAGSRGLD